MKKNKPEKLLKRIIKIFLFSIISLVLVQIYMAHRLATLGRVANSLEHQATKIARENELLNETINQKSSLSAVFEKAQILGFKPVEKIVYLASEVPVALGH